MHSRPQGPLPTPHHPWLGGAARETQPPLLFLERIQKVKEELEAEERLLESARKEVTAREVQKSFLQSVLDQACLGEFEPLIGYNTRIPALPYRNSTWRTRRPAQAGGHCRREAVKRKRSASHGLAATRSTHGKVETDKEKTETPGRSVPGGPRRSGRRAAR